MQFDVGPGPFCEFFESSQSHISQEIFPQLGLAYCILLDIFGASFQKKENTTSLRSLHEPV